MFNYLSLKPLLFTLTVLSRLFPRLGFFDLGPTPSAFLDKLRFTRCLFTRKSLAAGLFFRRTATSLLLLELFRQALLFLLLFCADASRLLLTRAPLNLSATALLCLALTPLGLFARALLLCCQPR